MKIKKITEIHRAQDLNQKTINFYGLNRLSMRFLHSLMLCNDEFNTKIIMK